MNKHLDLFLTFAKIGGCTFGGGYAMLPILQREVVEKKGWATEDQLADYYAVGQCTPGIIAVNTATFVGYTEGGVGGGVAATLGVVAPSVVIICIVAAFLQSFAQFPVVIHAFAGIRACVCALILSSVIKLAKKSVVNWWSAVLFAVVLFLSAFIGLSPVLLVVLAGACGLAVRTCARYLRGGKGGAA